MKNHIQEYFEIDVAFPEFYEPYYHHSGFNHPNLYIIKMDEQGAIYPARWGYIPKWGMADINSFEKRYNTLNIKSEKLFTGISNGYFGVMVPPVSVKPCHFERYCNYIKN